MPAHTPATACIPIGHKKRHSTLAPPPPKIFYEDPELARHAGTPWLTRHLAERHGLVPPPSPDVQPSTGKGAAVTDGTVESGAVDVPLELLGRHAILFGASGSGKTRLTLRLLREQLQAGRSAVVLDFKAATVRETLAIAQEAGLASEQISLLWTGDAREGVPGWNPFAVPVEQADAVVRAFKDIFASAYKDAWGPRMDDVLENAATVIAAQGLSVLELVRFLQLPAYHAGLLAQAQGTPGWAAFPEQHEYFVSEFAALSEGERGKYVAPILNKVRKLLTIPYLRALLCARADTLDLAGLWKRPRLLAVHLDEDALGKDGTRLLAGMLAHQLYNLSMHRPGPLPVVLCLDELGTQERFLGEAIRNIVEKGRQQGLWLIGAGQHFAQISEELRSLLLGSTAFQAYFRLGPEDARKVSAFLTTGAGERATRIALGVTRSVRVEPEYERALLPITDGWDVPLKVPQSEFSAMQYAPGGLIGAVRTWAGRQGVPRVYVRLPDGSACELGRFLSRTQATLAPALPLRLEVRFPRPTVRIEERESEAQRGAALTRLLADLPVREAVIRTDVGACAHVLVAAMPDPAVLPDPRAFFAGRTAEEVAQTYQMRHSEIARLSQDVPPAPPRNRAGKKGKAEPRAALSNLSETAAAFMFPPAPGPSSDPSAFRGSSSDLPIELSVPPAEPEVADDGSL